MADIIEYCIYLGLYGNLDFNTQVEQPPLTYKEYSEVEDRNPLIDSIKDRINMGLYGKWIRNSSHISERTGIPIYGLYVKAD